MCDKIVGPARTAIGCPHPVGRGLRGTMDQHQRIALTRMTGCQDLDIHLTVHPLLARFADIRAADIKIPAAGDCRFVGARDRFGGPISRPGGVTEARQHK